VSKSLPFHNLLSLSLGIFGSDEIVLLSRNSSRAPRVYAGFRPVPFHYTALLFLPQFFSSRFSQISGLSLVLPFSRNMVDLLRKTFPVSSNYPLSVFNEQMFCSQFKRAVHPPPPSVVFSKDCAESLRLWSQKIIVRLSVSRTILRDHRPLPSLRFTDDRTQ